MKLGRITIKQSALKLVLTFVFIFVLGGVCGFVRVNAADITINTAEDFATYSQNYTEANKNDNITIIISSGSFITNSDFRSLGTSAAPFSGTINVPSTGIDTFDLYNSALFDYVTTDVQITGGGTVKIRRHNGDGTSGALFANHVVAGTNAANWTVLLDSASDGTSFSGLIGDVADNCTVTVNFTNNSNLAISGSGNIGYICGTLGAGATLNVTTAGSGSALSVTSSGGHAGGLVGEMKAGAKLVLKSANNTRVNSVTTTGSGKYAGGIVGSVDNVTADSGISLDGVTDYAVSGTVTGNLGAGGLFGYYKNSIASVTFTLNNTYSIASAMTISSSSYTGGVFGMLENNGASFKFDGNSSSETLKINLSGGTSRGGVCGGYKTNSLSNTLEITNTAPTVAANTATNNDKSSGGTFSGGLIGTVTGDTAAYISIHDVSCLSYDYSDGSCLDGGLIGSIGDKGTFVDVSGLITISGRFDGGLICHMGDGVLRIQGTTDMSGYIQRGSSGWTSGYIVKTRNRALIYALGTGANYDNVNKSGWTFKRNTANPATIDDIHSWGEVIRVDGVKLAENDLFAVNDVSHTVTLKSAVTSMSSVTGFAKTALNIKLGTDAGKGALQFETPTQSSTLLGGPLSISTNIDLSGTGLTGFTRDDGSNAAFSGTFNGNNYTITLATGEVYGADGSGTELTSSASDQGNIRRHQYNGLFAKTNNAVVENLELAGEFNIIQDVNNTYIGGIAANATGRLTLTDVTVTALELNYVIGGNYTTYIGGAVGFASGNSLTVTVGKDDGSTNFKPVAVDKTPSDKVRGNLTYVGGVIGYVGAGTSQSITMSNVTIGIDYTKSINTLRESCFGSAVGGIGNITYNNNSRTVTLDTVTVDMTATGTAANKKFGGILGTDWYSADVTISGLVVSNATITANGIADFGGLVHTATGYWDIQSITVTNANFKVNAANSTFGFVANKTYNTASDAETALYLDVNYADYDIAALTFNGSTGTFTNFDEIVADSRFSSNSIVSNGNSIISVTINPTFIQPLVTPQTAYLNKTVYGKSANGAVNPNTRYYYNIAYARANTATQKYNFLVFSVKQYAHSSLSAWFESSGSFTGELDMTGLSYYPVDLKESVTFTNATLKLDNNTTEACVKSAYTGDTGVRTTRSNTNQHYLMHTAVFRNATPDLTITTGLTIQGNVPKISDSICGFLVAGTLGGKESGDPTEFTASNIVFDGAYVSNAGSNFTNTTYAPLLINKIGRNTNFTLNGASQSTSAYSSYESNGYYAGSSLIGDVGNNTARGINLTFTGLVFDGRSTATSVGNMDTTYGTERSIFSRAIILNSFIYYSESSGTYNYELSEDWTNSTTAAHHVTYGKEIKSSSEYPGKQKKYYDSEYYTHPTSYQSESEYDFSTGFLPYVYTAYNLSEYKHELAVNISYNIIIGGYGKYDDPYIIDDDDKLPIISRILNGTDVGSSVKINLPSDLTNFDYTTTVYNKGRYSFGTTNFTKISGDGSDTQTYANVLCYLAGAYYVIKSDITLPADYVALGTTTNAQYAFRGVIIGEAGSDGLGNTVYPTITNESREPLIKSSNGCVLKNLTVNVDVDYNSSNVVTLATPTGNSTYAYSGGIQSYGALIGQIMGGDTIIDNVQVAFTDISFTWSTPGSNFNRLTPVGGYVGVIVNGGLIFRNMTGTYNGLTSAKLDKVADAGYLYVNPIIGRVIAGYAFNETANTYNVTSAKISNGTKNYTVPDLSLSAGKLTITDSASKFTITVPNGQAMYVLGAIINSGASSAPTGGSIGNLTAYEPLSDFWQAYRAHTASRADASYNFVGNTSAGGYAADLAKAANDKYTSDCKKIPYVIRVYTSDSNSMLYARSLTKRDNNIIKITGDCDVAAGFRGIGSIYYDSDHVRLPISSMSGLYTDANENERLSTVTLHMRYLEYDPSNENYKAAINNKIDNNGYYVSKNAGFGLFNRLVFTGSGYINDFYLSGSVYYDVLGISTGTSISYSWSDNNVKAYNVLNVGGLAGIAVDIPLNIQNVNFADLTVTGPKYAGGLVGCLSIANNNDALIDKCGTKPDAEGNTITVTGGKTAGGLFGYVHVGGNAATTSHKGSLTIQGDSNNKTELKAVNITVSGPMDVSDERLRSSAGGLIGFIDAAYGNTDKYGLTIEKMIINGGSLTLTERNTNNKYYASAGGVIGGIRGHRISISNVDIQGVSFYADIIGGVIGYSYTYKVSECNFDNIVVDGQITEGNNASMDAIITAGGFWGCIEYKDAPQVEIYFDSIRINNYNLSSSNKTNGNTSVGGMVGDMRYSNQQAVTKSLILRNIEIKGCTLSADYTSAGNHSGVGGLFGTATGYNNQWTYYGYNILIDAVLGGDAALNYGAIVGKNLNDAVIKIVGVSTNITTTKTLGTTENPNGYAVYADYNGVQTHTSFAGIDDVTRNTDNYTDVTPAYPYVTANDRFTFSGITLTGNGIAANVAGLPIQSIITDGLTGKHKYSASSYYTGASGDTNLAAFNTYAGNLSMFISEATGYSGTDFPVLVLESSDRAVSQKMINSYLRLLTNTTYDFSSDLANVFSVVIYNIAASENVFTISATGASLKRDSSGFYMENASYDSGKAQFSLIDIRFYDPADTSKVAYHLYVPVFVRKVLSYRFDIAALSGTTYLPSNYTSRYGVQLIENIGTPVTLYFSYTYSRNASEWEAAINAGESVNRYYEKTLLFTKANDNFELLKDFPEDTVLVLVDRQTGIPYYSTVGIALTSSQLNPRQATLDLSTFRSVMTKNGDTLTFSGSTFEPKKFQDMMTLSVVVDNENGRLVACDAASATVIINGQGYRYATDGELENDTVVKYTVSVDSAPSVESYYLSIFTPPTENYDKFHYFIVTSPSSFNDNTYPSKITDTGDHTMVHLIMGNIFYHDEMSIESSSLTQSDLMNSSNNRLNFNMTVQLGLSDSLGDIKGEMADRIRSVEVFQGFLVYLNRKDQNGTTKAILGNPSYITSTYSVDNVLNETADTSPGSYTYRSITQNYAEIVTGNLSSYFATGNKFEINASVTIEYGASAIASQFPGRSDLFPDNGVTVSGASNIAFSQSATAYSKNTISSNDENDNSYYSDVEPEAASLDLNAVGDRVGDFTPLGINALNVNGISNAASAELDLLAVLDVTTVADTVSGYDQAVIAVTLSQKQNDGTYGAPLDISQYMSLTVGEAAATDNDTSYSATVGKANLSDNGAEITMPTLHFIVKTGSELETAGLLYGNYRVDVSVELKHDGVTYSVSRASNYIIYTNAKIVPTYID